MVVVVGPLVVVVVGPLVVVVVPQLPPLGMPLAGSWTDSTVPCAIGKAPDALCVPEVIDDEVPVYE